MVATKDQTAQSGTASSVLKAGVFGSAVGRNGQNLMSATPVADSRPALAGLVASAPTLRQQQQVSLKADALKTATKSFTGNLNSSISAWRGAMHENMPPASSRIFSDRREVTDILLEQLLGCEAAVSRSAGKAVLAARMVRPLAPKQAGGQSFPSSPSNPSLSGEQGMRPTAAKRVVITGSDAEEKSVSAVPANPKAGSSRVEASRGALDRAVACLESASKAQEEYMTAPAKKELSSERAVFFFAQAALDLGLAEEAVTAAEKANRKERARRKRHIQRKLARLRIADREAATAAERAERHIESLRRRIAERETVLQRLEESQQADRERLRTDGAADV